MHSWPLNWHNEASYVEACGASIIVVRGADVVQEVVAWTRRLGTVVGGAERLQQQQLVKGRPSFRRLRQKSVVFKAVTRMNTLLVV